MMSEAERNSFLLTAIALQKTMIEDLLLAYSYIGPEQAKQVLKADSPFGIAVDILLRHLEIITGEIPVDKTVSSPLVFFDRLDTLIAGSSGSLGTPEPMPVSIQSVYQRSLNLALSTQNITIWNASSDRELLCGMMHIIAMHHITVTSTLQLMGDKETVDLYFRAVSTLERLVRWS